MPVHLLAVAAVVTAVVLGSVCTLTALKIRWARTRDESSSDDYGITNATRMVAGIFALLSSFMIANLWSGQSDLDGRLTEELSALTGLVDQISISAPDRTAAADRLEIEYLTALRDDELLRDSDLRPGGLRFTPSPATSAALAGLQQMVREIAPRADRAYLSFLGARVTRLGWQPGITKMSLIPLVVISALMTFLVGFQEPGQSRVSTWLGALLPAVAICVMSITIAALLDPASGDARRAAAITSYLETFPQPS